MSKWGESPYGSYKNIKDYQANWKLKKLYNLTKKEHEELIKNQKNICAICKLQFGLTKRRHHIDHCEKTNQIRGLLCSKCNMAIGLINHNIQILKNAIEYLSRYS